MPPARGTADAQGRARPPVDDLWSGRLLGLLAAVAVGLPLIIAVLLIMEFGVLEDTKELEDTTAEAAAIEAPQTAASDPLETVPSSSPSEAPIVPAVATAVAEADAAPPELGEVYVVVAGDVLHAIASRFGVSIEAMAAYNALSNPNALRVGQKLRIPPADYVPPSDDDLPE